MKAKILIIAFCSVLIGQINGQWAGATSDGGSERAPIKQKSTSNLNTGEKRGRLTLGIGMGGYAQDVCEVALPVMPLYISGYITSITSNPDPWGFNFFMNGMRKTSYRNLWYGFEWGVNYAGKTVEYDYYRTLSGTISSSSDDILYIHTGVGIPLRYYFKESQDLDLYAQGVFGYGYIWDLNNNDEPQGIFYGGGAIGARFTVLFAELGYNSTGYLRFGLSIPTNNK